MQPGLNLWRFELLGRSELLGRNQTYWEDVYSNCQTMEPGFHGGLMFLIGSVLGRNILAACTGLACEVKLMEL